jgi:carboxypeptidase C (cathepsin A)
MRAALWCLALMMSFPVVGWSQKKTAEPSTKAKETLAKEEPEAKAVSTHHTVEIAGKNVPYTATAGTIILHNDKDEPTAKVFYIAYTKDGVSNPASRPVTFAYNGGPGGASALVDFGGFGPRKIVWPQPGSTAGVRPPYQMEPNPDTLLATTDPPKGTAKMFYGVKPDSHAFTHFIEQYISKYHRWGSAKFLLGESYGTTRSAVLAQELAEDGVYLNGVVLCSTVLNFPTITFAPGDDLPFILFLPSYAATAWYHHRLQPEPASLPELVKKAEAFAEGPYATALFKGSALGDTERQSVARKLADFTSLPASLWLKSNLRISAPVFRRKLMGEADESTGRYDSRYTIDQLQPLLPVGGTGSTDASASAMWGALTASFNDYLERRLNYHSEKHYIQLSYKVNEAWDWKYTPPVEDLLGQGAMFLNVAPALARAMNNDPELEVMVNNGYYDMATPFFATEYTLRHTDFPKDAWKRITTKYYECGHMLYVNPKTEPLLNRNINEFIAKASSHH